MPDTAKNRHYLKSPIPRLLVLFILLIISRPGQGLRTSAVPGCYNYPIAREYALNPGLTDADNLSTADYLWLGRVSDFAIRARGRLSFAVMIIAEQLALADDYPAHALEHIQMTRRIRVSAGDLGSFAVYMEINPRNLAQRDNLREFIEQELQQDNAHILASGHVDRMVTFAGQRYPLLAYSEISLSPDFKIVLDPRPRLFRTDIAYGLDQKQTDKRMAGLCKQLRQCENRWDQSAATRCR